MDPETVIDSRDRSRRASSLAQVACAAGLVAAAAHAAVVREHLAHWWGYGTFFAVVAVAQALAAVALYRRPNRRLMLAVAIGNLGLILLYALSRAGGTSFVGPHAGHAEPIGLLDLIANAAEAIQLAVVVSMLRRSEQVARRAEGRPRRLAAVALLAVAAIAVAVPGAPAHVKSPTSTIEILAAAAPTSDLLQPHDLHTDQPQPTPPVEEPPYESPPPCTPHATGGDVAAIQKGAVVYSHDGDLWLASPPDGKVRRLTTDEGDCWEHAATFRDRDTITFSSDEAIYDLELESGRLKQIVEVPGSVAAMAWNATGSRLAFVNWGSVDSPPTLRVYTPSTDDVRTVRSFSEAEGRCGGPDDESSVAWGQDGKSLLLVSTILDYTEDTMFVMDLEGKDLVAPRLATHARWTGDPDTIVYRGLGDPGRWYSLDLRSARSTGVPMRPGTHHASVSPDGRYIAYSDEAERPTTYIFDLDHGTERVLARGYAAPLWLSFTEIGLTKTAACGEDCMGHGMWMEAGETAAFNLSGDRTRSLSMTTTVLAAALLAPESTPSPTPPSSTPSSPTPSPSPSPSETANPLPLSTDPPPTSPEPSPSPMSLS